MLSVKTPEEVLSLIESEFNTVTGIQTVPLSAAMGRVLAEDIAAQEYVPDFNRSTVDGYAVRARDTFGCTMPFLRFCPCRARFLWGRVLRSS